MQHYQQGLQLFKDGAYDASLVELQTSYKIAQTYKLLYNIAQVYRQLNDFANAYDSYDRYLKDGGTDIAQARRDEVRLEMVKLAARIGHVRVTTNAKAFDLSVDDAPAKMRGADMDVNEGRRRITAVDRDSGASQTKVVSVLGTETAQVSFDFVPRAPVASGPSPTFTPPRPTGHVSYTPVWISAGVTVGLAVTGGVFGALALSAKSDYDDALKNGPNNGSSISSAHHRANDFALASDITLGVAAAGAVVTVVLLVTRKPVEDAVAQGFGGVRF